MTKRSRIMSTGPNSKVLTACSENGFQNDLEMPASPLTLYVLQNVHTNRHKFWTKGFIWVIKFISGKVFFVGLKLDFISI